MQTDTTVAIILAAGKGTRMQSPKPKVLHEVCGITLLGCVIEAVQKAGITQIVVVVGEQKEEVKESLRGVQVKAVEQSVRLGTAHAVQSAQHLVLGSQGVVVLNGDAPLIKPLTIKRLITASAETNADVTLLTAMLDRPQGYGRIFRNSHGSIKKIIEENDADNNELKIREINAGIYAFQTISLLEGLAHIKPNNKKKEFYLTDIVSVFCGKGRKVEGVVCEDATEVLGVNTQLELAVANKIRRDEILCSYMERGITIVDPEKTFIENHVEIGDGSVVYPFTYIGKNVIIGRRCSIGPFAYIRAGARIGDNEKIQDVDGKMI
jgi:bifunctional UDP-N-acetylglucosamine pyrophosphorylase/glucosamine-1-phosphate N-acetyltransferase